MIHPIIQFVFFAAESVLSVAMIYLLIQAILKKTNQATPVQTVLVLGLAFVVHLCLNYIFPYQEELNNAFFSGFIIGAAVRTATSIIIAMVCFRAKPLIAVAMAFLEIIIGMITVFIIIGIVGLGFDNIGVIRDGVLRTSQYSEFATIMSIPIHVLVIVVIRHFRNFNIENRYFKLPFIISVIAFVFAFILMRVIVILHLHPQDYVALQELLALVPLFAIAFAIAPILILASGLGGQSINKQKIFLLESQHLAQLTHIEQLMNSYEKVRKMSHDFKHQISILHALSAENEHDKLAEYISNLSGQDASISIVETGNIMLDAVLSFKKEKAETEGIAYNFKLDVLPNLPYINDKVCVLLSNALDNALEACMRINKTGDIENERYISMDLTATESAFMCRIKNAVGMAPQMENGRFTTIKANKTHHGIGMQSMKQTCEDLGGDLAYEYDEKEFRLWITLDAKLLMQGDNVDSV